MDNIKLSVRELVEFVYKSGDINVKGLSPDRAMEGIKAHKLLQSMMGDNYNKEFFLKHEFIFGNIQFTVEGRADGIITAGEEITIDEIKSTYTNLDFINENEAHMAQAKCYGYIYCLQNNIKSIYIQLRYYNLETKKTRAFIYRNTFEELENFFNNLINLYIEWAHTVISMQNEKTKSIHELNFPFNEYRKGQRDFSVAVFSTIKQGKKLFAQAPTGVGKTVSVLFPAIKSMNYKYNSKIYYLTAKSSTKTIAYDTIKLMVNNGLMIRTTVITAKDKICFMDETNCDPEYCPYAKGYYDRLSVPLRNSIKNNFLFDRKYIEKTAADNQLCPFEFSLDLAYMSHIIICDYNYYFDPRAALQRDDVFKNNNDILLIDEAHNLEDRTREMYSPELIKEEFLELNKLMKKTNKKLSTRLNDINKMFLEIKNATSGETMKLQNEPAGLIRSVKKFSDAAEIYINDNKNEIIPKELTDMYFKCIFFIKISEIKDSNYCYYVDFSDGNTKIKLFLTDPSFMLKSILKNACSSIFFLATLTPLKYFRYILGGDESDYILKIKSPFNENNFKLMITSNVSMRYSLREANIQTACGYIKKCITLKDGNYMVFFPSYSFMNKVFETYEGLYDISNIILQNRGLSEEEQNAIINKFKNENNIVLFTVVGGVFSEGVDLPLENLIGAVIIGTGIPQISFERNIIKDFFDEKFNSGYDFAYKYPGFNKIMQSAGRVIRTDDDKGMVLLIDSRLSERTYSKLFPEHWKHYINIRNQDSLDYELDIFWNKKENYS